MNKGCKQCGEGFEVTEEDLKFYEQMSPCYGGKKYLIPTPDYCPRCRLQRRMCFRNERTLYRRKCDATGANIISCYSPDTSYIVYDHDYWWSDKWDASIYGRDFDFVLDLTEQLNNLSLIVPHNSLVTTNCINTDYVNYLLNSRNCYLVFGGSHDEDCLYGKFIVNCKNVVDCLSVNACEFCYEGNSCDGCYGCRFLVNCKNCSDCLMIEECIGCRNCIACFGLRNQEYCFGNQKIGKEAYQNLLEEFRNLNHDQILNLQNKLDELKKDLPYVQSHIYASENCCGDNILNSKNCDYAFDVRNCEDCKYINFAPFAVHCMDHIFSAPGPTEFCYQTCSIVGNTNSMSLFMVWGAGDKLFYCMECHSCSDCFACVGLKNKKYCILNKQYSKEDYEVLVAKIIEHMQKTGEWGQFLDPQLSSFGHNETVAQEYFRWGKEDAVKAGFKWKDDVNKQFKEATFKVNKSETIEGINDSIIDEILVCGNCKKNYRIILEELRSYRLMNVPLPVNCSDCRHMKRIRRRNDFNLYISNCANCGNKVDSIYESSEGKKVYCEKCYLREAY